MKIKYLFAKLQILGNTPILFLKTNFDSLYENSPKQDYIEYLATTTLNAASFQKSKISSRITEKLISCGKQSKLKIP